MEICRNQRTSMEIDGIDRTLAKQIGHVWNHRNTSRSVGIHGDPWESTEPMNINRNLLEMYGIIDISGGL